MPTNGKFTKDDANDLRKMADWIVHTLETETDTGAAMYLSKVADCLSNAAANMEAYVTLKSPPAAWPYPTGNKKAAAGPLPVPPMAPAVPRAKAQVVKVADRSSVVKEHCEARATVEGWSCEKCQLSWEADEQAPRTCAI